MLLACTYLRHLHDAVTILDTQIPSMCNTSVLIEQISMYFSDAQSALCRVMFCSDVREGLLCLDGERPNIAARRLYPRPVRHLLASVTRRAPNHSPTVVWLHRKQGRAQLKTVSRPRVTPCGCPRRARLLPQAVTPCVSQPLMVRFCCSLGSVDRRIKVSEPSTLE